MKRCTDTIEDHSSEPDSAFFRTRHADRGYATCRLFGKDAGSIRGCGRAIVCALQVHSGSTDRRTTPRVFLVSGQRAEGLAADGDDRLVWDQVFLSTNTQRDWTTLGLVRPRPE